ncbi:WD40 repeat domain-containing protein [Paenibacillus sp. JNUCC32]|uniref:WD40 repeat domain-containing protein n=1 Tax=Paenibacillus sp. JNUCC32 TaxID=2777984 RepID=UPI00178834A9|nr:WD40 repeat domain-containing protein [Paenibacillus sp. JNUCC-32]QOT11161.1 WD40 repeat domain-containing protein [Paenibacillus sp. JNUCC-32]
MKHRFGKHGIKLLSIVAVAAALAACQSQDRLTIVEPGSQTSQPPVSNAGGGKTPGERKLTVVDGASGQAGREVVVNQTHRIASSNIETWISEDMVRVTTTKMVKEATATEEPKYAYATEEVNVSTGEQRELTNHEASHPGQHLVKEEVSPDGKYSFVQKWRDKYTADNFMKDLNTGKSIPVKGDNYMEIGGWLDADTYVLAAGSMSGKGEIRLISTDGTYTTTAIEDEDVEVYNQFGASKGRIYYTDVNQVLKVVEPGQSKPVQLIENVWSFTISPDGEYIAVSTATNTEGNSGSNLLIYDAAGSLQGSLIGKGNLISYPSWSPDSARLAFDVYSENESGMNGVYVFDTASGKVSWMAPYYSAVHPAAHPVYPLTWSPSGKRLGITIDDKEALIATHVIDFQ